MKNWQESTRICQQILACHQKGQTVALATVIQIKGSAYRRPGAKLLIEPDGALLGNVSGGCLELDLREVGLEVLRTGQACLKHYDTSDEEDKLWGLGLGCNGAVDLLVEALPPGDSTDLIAKFLERLEGQDPFRVQYRIAGGRSLGLMQIDEGSSGEPLDPAKDLFVEALNPPPRCIICGADDDARPIVRFAAEVGFRVVVIDHRSAFRTEARFPEAVGWYGFEPKDVAAISCDQDTFVVVKTHNMVRDRAWLEAFEGEPVRYIGLLGPQARRHELLKDLEPRLGARIFGPVGLDLGGEGPEQVGLSIVAEMMTVWFQRECGHLRDGEASIHPKSEQ